MSRIKNTLEMRGIQREDFIEYFLNIGGQSTAEGVYTGPYWEVQVGPQIPCPLGKLVIPSMKITFSVEEEYYDEILRKFRMNFMRGGA
jgi:hypothetical protein